MRTLAYHRADSLEFPEGAGNGGGLSHLHQEKEIRGFKLPPPNPALLYTLLGVTSPSQAPLLPQTNTLALEKVSLQSAHSRSLFHEPYRENSIWEI